MKNSPKQKWSLVLNVTLAVVMLSLVTAVGATSLTAATFTVSNVNDSGVGSLRQAILEANARPGADEITFAQLEGTITLTSGQLAITDDLSIVGPGAEKLAVSGNDLSRVFDVEIELEVVIEGQKYTAFLRSRDQPIV